MREALFIKFFICIAPSLIKLAWLFILNSNVNKIGDAENMYSSEAKVIIANKLNEYNAGASANSTFTELVTKIDTAIKGTFNTGLWLQLFNPAYQTITVDLKDKKELIVLVSEGTLTQKSDEKSPNSIKYTSLALTIDLSDYSNFGSTINYGKGGNSYMTYDVFLPSTKDQVQVRMGHSAWNGGGRLSGIIVH